MNSPPAFDIVAPTGHRVTVVPATPHDTMATLARALGCDPTDVLEVDGGIVEGCRRLNAVSTLRHGSTVRVAPVDDVVDAVEDPAAARFEVAVCAGPACRSWQMLSVRHNMVGRAAAAHVRVDDPDAELHHGVLEVDQVGDVWWTQLTGRVAVQVGGVSVTGRTRVCDGDEISLGASRIVVREVPEHRRVHGADALRGGLVASEHDPWRSVVQRGPARSDLPPPSPLVVPAVAPDRDRSSPTMLVGALIGLLGATLAAVLLRQPMFLMFAGVGAVATLATFAAGELSSRRRHRTATTVHRTDVDRFRIQLESLYWQSHDRHVAKNPTLVELLGEIAYDPRDGRIWERRRGPDGSMRASVGSGSLRVPVRFAESGRNDLEADLLVLVTAAELIDAVSAPVTFVPGHPIAIQGSASTARAVARSIVVQLATLYGPADWRLVVAVEDPSEWQWAAWLPHARAADGAARILDACDLAAVEEALEALDDGGPIPFVVVDDPTLLTVATGPLRRRVTARTAHVLGVVDVALTVPAACGRILSVGSTGNASWIGEVPPEEHAERIALTGMSIEAAGEIARRLAGLIDPEVDRSAAAIPTIVGTGELLGFDLGAVSAGSEVARNWLAADRALVPVGRSVDGVVEVDLDRDGPHGLIAGTTGSGKSELLRSIVVGLALRHGPDRLNFVLVDYKGGSTFDGCAELPHVVGLVTDLDDGLAARALISVDAELRRREHLFRDLGASNLLEFWQLEAAPCTAIARLVVVIDEFAALASDVPEFLAALVSTAQRGRSLGVHLLLATQRPSGVVSDQIRANTNLRLALRLHDRHDANDVVNDHRPAHFPRSCPGRAVMRLGPGELVEFQVATCMGSVGESNRRLRIIDHNVAAVAPVSVPTELHAAVTAIRWASDHLDVPTARPLWREPLPATVDSSALAEVCEGATKAVVGVIDDLELQSRRPLSWDHVGNLQLIGSIGSGTTSALIALGMTWCLDDSNDGGELYVIDGRGESALDVLAAAPRCGGIVRITEVERLHRLLMRLGTELERRVGGALDRPPIAVLIDGLGPLRLALASIERTATMALLGRVLADGAAVGVVVVSTVDDASQMALTFPVADRWIFHVGDPSIVRSLGVTTRPVPPGCPGRLRIASSGLEAQIVAPLSVDEATFALAGTGSTRLGDGARCRPIAALPSVVDASSLPSSGIDGPAASEVLHLVVGLQSDDLEPAVLDVRPATHIFIGGSAQTGRTTALERIVDCWVDARPNGRVIRLHPTERLDGRAVTHGPTLIVVDDAERVDDVGGTLASLLSDQRPELTFAIATRLDAVRQQFGHWTRDVARTRCGLILTSVGEIDGELLGATLPRRTLMGPRPGLGWLIDARGHRLVQVAGRMPSCHASSPSVAPNSGRSREPTIAQQSSRGS